MEEACVPVDPLGSSRQTVVFRLGSKSYGIDIFRVSEIVRLTTLTPLAASEPGVRGLLNLRGKTVPVIELRQRLDLPDQPDTSGSRIIVADTARGSVGFIVDEVPEVVSGVHIAPLTYLDIDEALAA